MSLYFTSSSRSDEMSTLVETVSIDCANFQDSFLTCSTCLCGYDAGLRSPKLLPCSHTVCLCCLEKMVALPGGNTAPQFSCPNCRDVVQVPSDGVQVLPPSFLVNQLLDLMNQESRRDRVPHCSVQISHGELLLCETCDVVFCSSCTDPDLQSSEYQSESSNHSNSSRHTVIPFGVAIKRMSEILLYKEYICKRNLDQAAEAVETEIMAVDRSAAEVDRLIATSFDDLQTMIEERKRDLQRDLQFLADEKRRKLRGQLQIIESERATIRSHGNETSTERLQCTDYNDKARHYEVRAGITKQISSLNDKLDIWRTLASPRDNAYIRYDLDAATPPIRAALHGYGRLHTSTTFPAMSHVRMVDSLPLSTHLTARLTLQTLDYNGEPRTIGDDPIRAQLSAGRQPIDCKVVDHANGQYSIIFTPTQAQCHRLNVKIFDRSIGGSPLNIEVTHHHRPVLTIGDELDCHRSSPYGGGVSKPGRECLFTQPVAVATWRRPPRQYSPSHSLVRRGDDGGRRDDHPVEVLYVLDSARARISVCDAHSGEVIDDLCLPSNDAAYTGLAVTRTGQLVVVNWRLKRVLILTAAGDIIASIDYKWFREPTVVCTSPDSDELYVGDNSAGAVFVFNSLDGAAVRTIKSKDASLFKQITALCCYKDKLIIADGSRMRIYSLDGAFIRVLDAPNARYSGLSVDEHGHCLAVRTERVAGIAVRVFKPLQELLARSPSATGVLKPAVNQRTLPRGESFSCSSTSRRLTQTLPATGTTSPTRAGTTSPTSPTRHGSTSTIGTTSPTSPTGPTEDAEYIYDIDSEGSRLKRPAGLAIGSDGHCYVCDLSSQCVRKYRYR